LPAQHRRHWDNDLHTDDAVRPLPQTFKIPMIFVLLTQNTSNKSAIIKKYFNVLVYNRFSGRNRQRQRQRYADQNETTHNGSV
jgi:hypothetical protein